MYDFLAGPVGRRVRWSVLASGAVGLLAGSSLAQPAVVPPASVAPAASASAPEVPTVAAPVPSAGPPPSMLAPNQQPMGLFAPPLPALPDTPEPSKPRVEVAVDLRNLFLHRNDSDFDRTAPIYNKNGQSVGAFATVFRPTLTFHASEDLRIVYELELGLNFWSRNNPDQESPQAADAFRMKHRQVFTEGMVMNRRVGFKVGYQLFEDPTGLFLGHWIGAAQAWYTWAQGQKVGAFFGQIPDQTYEGLNVQDNNFRHDVNVFGPRLDLQFGKQTHLATAVYGLYDAHLVGRTRWLVAPSARLSYASGAFTGFADAVLQAGRATDMALGNETQSRLAWATQLHGALDTRPAAFDVNVLVLSSDDAKDGNKNDGTFLYSSRNKSATIILTEDELRNWYDQLDRTMGAFRGGFWEHRAGLMVADVKAKWFASDVFRPALVLGGGSVLQKNAALGNRFVGIEGDLNLEFRASDNLSANLVLGGLIPGSAASALQNRIDRTATAPIYMIEAMLLARY